MQFIRHIGHNFIAGRAAVLYSTGDGYTIRAETAGGKLVRRKDSQGRVYSCSRHVSADELKQLEDSWSAGEPSAREAGITYRALLWLDAIADEDE